MLSAVCIPSCDNGGICTAPNTYSCQSAYSGPRCETYRLPVVGQILGLFLQLPLSHSNPHYLTKTELIYCHNYWNLLFSSTSATLRPYLTFFIRQLTLWSGHVRWLETLWSALSHVWDILKRSSSPLVQCRVLNPFPDSLLHSTFVPLFLSINDIKWHHGIPHYVESLWYVCTLLNSVLRWCLAFYVVGVWISKIALFP